jgi:hypothetical protein
MKPNVNTKIVLAERPVNRAAVEQDFRIEREAIPVPGAGEVLVRTAYLSLDPYMRTRMSTAKSYTAPIEVGQVMIGEVVGEVIESRHPDFHGGECVLARSGWQEYAALPGDEVVAVDPEAAPPSYYLGVLGMPGMTAYFGLIDVCRPQAGECVFVPAAVGAVGQIVGQIAKHQGCRVIGSVGSKEKAAYAMRELGFDACMVYRGRSTEELTAEIARICPEGVNVFYDSVGGILHDAVMQNIALAARIVIVGAVARASRLEEPDIGPRWMRQLLAKRARMEGFLVWDYADRVKEFRRTMLEWLEECRIRYREDVAQGLDAAPRAFTGMLAGANFGKQVVKVYA